MNRRQVLVWLLGSLLFRPVVVLATDHFGTRIPLRYGDSATYYVGGHVVGAGAMEFMVDTGSGFLTINQEMLASLQRTGHATYSRQLRGVLADGRELEVPLYVLDRISIGRGCLFENVEAAVFPGSTRPILGLNALRRAAPFAFSFDPPSLLISNCPGEQALARADALSDRVSESR